MRWYLVHTKPRQEACALQNLMQQGYECYLPMLPAERLRQGALTVANEPLFPRYLFVRLGDSESAKSWAPIRSTKGVSRLVSFGNQPAKVSDGLVEVLKKREVAGGMEPQRLFRSGDRVRVTEGPFAGIEGVFQMPDGNRRALILIELLNRPVSVQVWPGNLRKAG